MGGMRWRALAAPAPKRATVQSRSRKFPARPGGRQSPGSRLAIQWSPRFLNFSFRTVNAALSA
jgi:hypothetical protein